MGHHRFIAQFEIIVQERGNTDTTAPDPMPVELVNDLIKEISAKAQPKDKNGQQYKVEKAKKK